MSGGANRRGKAPEFIVHQRRPFNGGPLLRTLREHRITPRSLHYVRSHGPVPRVNASVYHLLVNGMVETPLSLSLDSIQRDFPKHVVTVTMQCAGNRRLEMLGPSADPNAVMWDTEGISTATWGGIALRDVLMRAGVPVDDAAATEGLHASFSSLDKIKRGSDTFSYGASIPLSRALRPEVLLAYEMNGDPLPALHGAPLRVVVPGYVAARSVKWLGSIRVQDAPSDNHYQVRDYKVFPPHVHAENVNWSQGETLYALRSDAVIFSPLDGDTIDAGTLVMRGYALAGGDALVTRVEVSADDGATWHDAELLDEARRWTWRFWEARLSLPPGSYTLVARVHDDAGTVQPARAADTWNFRGYMNNSLHRVQVTLR